MILTQKKMQQALNCTNEADKESIANYLADLKQLQIALTNYDDPAQVAKLARLANKIAANNRMNELYDAAYDAAKAEKRSDILAMLIEQRRVIRSMVNQARLCELYYSGKYQDPKYALLFHALTAEFLQDCDPNVQISKGCTNGNEGVLAAESVREGIANDKSPVAITPDFSSAIHDKRLMQAVAQNILRDANFFNGIYDTAAFAKISQSKFPGLATVNNKGLDICTQCGEQFSTHQMKPGFITLLTDSSLLNFTLKPPPPPAKAKSAAVTVDWKGGTYNKLLSAMQFQTAPAATASQHTIMHSDPFKKAKEKELDKVEIKPKIRPDSTSTR